MPCCGRLSLSVWFQVTTIKLLPCMLRRIRCLHEEGAAFTHLCAVQWQMIDCISVSWSEFLTPRDRSWLQISYERSWSHIEARVTENARVKWLQHYQWCATDAVYSKNSTIVWYEMIGYCEPPIFTYPLPLKAWFTLAPSHLHSDHCKFLCFHSWKEIRNIQDVCVISKTHHTHHTSAFVVWFYRQPATWLFVCLRLHI